MITSEHLEKTLKSQNNTIIAGKRHKMVFFYPLCKTGASNWNTQCAKIQNWDKVKQQIGTFPSPTDVMCRPCHSPEQ